MRVWSIHPRYLDSKGLVALWRETLLAQNVLLENTRGGYKNHPQLIRFKASASPIDYIANYLHGVCDEAVVRGYQFDRSKIVRHKSEIKLVDVTIGQMLYEWKHFLQKIEKRDCDRFYKLQGLQGVDPHPLFSVLDGEVECWEVV